MKPNGYNTQYFAINTETCRKVRTNGTAGCCSTYLLQSFYRHIIFIRDFYVKEKSIVLNTKANPTDVILMEITIKIVFHVTPYYKENLSNS